MTMSMDFSSMLLSAQDGDVLVPVVYRSLFDPTFKGYDVPVRGWTSRAYDGRFHPSTHATWTVRQLYLYLTRPNLLTEERMELSSVLAVTAGSFWHEFLQYLWLDDGIMIRQRPEVVNGVNPAEVVIRDEEVNVVGHADGELTNGDVVEIKTINDFQIHKITNEEILKEKKFEYWCQTQDYLAALQRETMRYFFLAPSYPYPMGEFTVRADKHYQRIRRSQYMRAMELADRYPDGKHADDKDSSLPVCCAPRSKLSKSCPARLACPIGRIV